MGIWEPLPYMHKFRKEQETIASEALDIVDPAVESAEVEAEVSTDILSTKESVSSASVVTDATPTTELDIAESEEAIVKGETQVELLRVDSPVEDKTVELNVDESTSGTDSNEQMDAPTTEDNTKEGCRLTLSPLNLLRNEMLHQILL